MPILMILLSVACTDYEVSTIKRHEPSNWFDDQSDDLRSDMDPEEADTGAWTQSDTGSHGDDHDDGSSDDEDWDDEDWGDDGWGDDDWDDDDGEGNGDGGGAGDGGASTDSEGSSGDAAGSTVPSGSDAVSARYPSIGDLVITELMIYPRATDDASGEWVEVRNVTGDWLDVSGHRLADRGIDDVEIEPVGEASLVIAPGGHLVLCAEANYWDNGGVDCNGTFRYWTLGGGFALANGEDEVQLRSPFGTVLDEVRYHSGFAVEGEAIGLKPTSTSVIANDSSTNWCAQDDFMAFGDAGTPGEQNNTCW